MFEKLQTGEKIHDAPGQPRTCSHPIYACKCTACCLSIDMCERPIGVRAEYVCGLLYFLVYGTTGYIDKLC